MRTTAEAFVLRCKWRHSVCLVFCAVALFGIASVSIVRSDVSQVAAYTSMTKLNPGDSCLNPHGPKPFILMTLGRSGSRSTWQVIGNLTGYETGTIEYPGSSTKKSLKNLDEFQNNSGQWILDLLCPLQESLSNAKTSPRVFGFKWKPFKGTLPHQAVLDGLKLISSLKHPPIKVVRSRRNMLDVLLSRAKHKPTKTRWVQPPDEIKATQQKVEAHCAKGDEECIQHHMEAGTGIMLNPTKLVKAIQSMTKTEDDVEKMLETFRVPHVKVSFEKLYLNNDVTEWERIFEFLSVDTVVPVTRENVNLAMNLAVTSNPHHNVTIGNYDQVKNVLENTSYKELLHRS